MSRRWPLALALALPACPAPTLQCPDLSEVPIGGSCAAPPRPIVIDGDLADWQSVPEAVTTCSSCYCDTCSAGEVITLRATPTTDRSLAFLVETKGAPGASYLLVMGPLAGPAYTLAIGITPTTSRADIEGFVLSNLSVSAAYGDEGVELAIPLDAMPFNGGALVYAVRGADDMIAQQIVPTIATCWDPTSPVCQPR